MFACAWNEHVAFVSHAQCVRDMVAGIAVLIEASDRAPKRPDRAGTQCAINVLENDASLIVAALIDERASVSRAGVEFAFSPLVDHEGVPGAPRLLIVKITSPGFAKITPVEFRRRVGDGFCDNGVIVTVEEIYFLALDVVERIDLPSRRLCFYFGNHWLQIGRWASHARPGGCGHRQGVAVEEIRSARLRAVERPTSHRPDTPDDR